MKKQVIKQRYEKWLINNQQTINSFVICSMTYGYIPSFFIVGGTLLAQKVKKFINK